MQCTTIPVFEFSIFLIGLKQQIGDPDNNNFISILCQYQCGESGSSLSLIKWPPGTGVLTIIQRNFRKKVQYFFKFRLFFVQ
jgi:hypothetical protein